MPGSSAKVRLVSDSLYTYSGFNVDYSLSLFGNQAVSASPGNLQALTNTSGQYSFAGLIPGTYTIKPVIASWASDPPERTVTIQPGQQSVNSDFVIYPANTVGGQVYSDPAAMTILD